MKIFKFTATILAAGMVLLAGDAVAHDDNDAGQPVCLEANYMMADAQNAPFGGIGAPGDRVTGPGRVIEMNIITGQRGITVANPFSSSNADTPICENGGVSCGGPWKPTGVLSGGMNGHAFLTSAAQHAITEFHRDGTPIRTASTLPTSPSPVGGNFGFVPRLLGSQIMPNGNLMQAVCDANFFNAPNSDPNKAGESAVDPGTTPPTPRPDNSSWQFFPPVYSTPERAANSRILVLDQETLEVIDEYSAPDDPRWSCPAGIAFTSEGMIVTGFHSAAAFIIDWKAGITEGRSTGVGSNSACHTNKKGKENCFEIGDDENKAEVIRVVDLLNEDMDGDGFQDAPDAAMDDPNRRDSLRANSVDESGNIYGTFRARSKDCLRGEAPGATSPNPSGVVCNPSVFRQHVFIAEAGGNVKTGTIAMDPGMNVIAGIRINRMSGVACDNLHDAGDITYDVDGKDITCDVETLYVAASAANPGCDADGDGNMGPGHAANRCFVPGGAVYEYRIDPAHIDGGNGKPCTGSPNDGYGAGEGNEGCAMPVAEFKYINADGVEEKVDPRMLMPIHEAFIQ